MCKLCPFPGETICLVHVFILRKLGAISKHTTTCLAAICASTLDRHRLGGSGTRRSSNKQTNEKQHRAKGVDADPSRQTHLCHLSQRALFTMHVKTCSLVTSAIDALGPAPRSSNHSEVQEAGVSCRYGWCLPFTYVESGAVMH